MSEKMLANAEETSEVAITEPQTEGAAEVVTGETTETESASSEEHSE